jgi:hypothetical protein
MLFVFLNKGNRSTSVQIYFIKISPKDKVLLRRRLGAGIKQLPL